MQRLLEINFQKCIDVMEDFHKSIPTNVFAGPLEAKKKHAEQSLHQLKVLFNARGENPCRACTGGNKQQSGPND